MDTVAVVRESECEGNPRGQADLVTGVPPKTGLAGTWRVTPSPRVSPALFWAGRGPVPFSVPGLSWEGSRGQPGAPRWPRGQAWPCVRRCGQVQQRHPADDGVQAGPVLETVLEVRQPRLPPGGWRGAGVSRGRGGWVWAGRGADRFVSWGGGVGGRVLLVWSGHSGSSGLLTPRRGGRSRGAAAAAWPSSKVTFLCFLSGCPCLCLFFVVICCLNFLPFSLSFLSSLLQPLCRPAPHVSLICLCVSPSLPRTRSTPPPPPRP